MAELTPTEQQESLAAAGFGRENDLSGKQKELALKTKAELKAREARGGVQSALNRMAGRVDQETIDNALNNNYTNSARKNEGEASMTVARAVSEQKFDAIPAVHAARQVEIRNQVEAVAMTIPGLEDIMRSMTHPTERQNFLDGIIKDPKFANIVKGKFEEALKTPIGQDVKEKQTRRDETKALSEAAIKAFNDNGKEIAGLLMSMEQIDALRGAGGLIGPDIATVPNRATLYNNANNRINTFKRASPANAARALVLDALNLDRQKQIITTAQLDKLILAGKPPTDPEYVRLLGEKTALDTSVNPQMAALNPAENVYLEAKETMQKVDLADRRAEMSTRLDAARNRDPELNQRMNTAIVAAKAANAALTAARSGRAFSENALNKKLNSIYGEAAKQYSEEVLRESAEAQKAAQDKQIEGIQDGAKREISKKMQKLFEQKGFAGLHPLNFLYNELMKNGPDGLALKLKIGKIKGVDQATLDQISDAMKNDEQLKEMMAMNLLRLKMKGGMGLGKVSDKDIDVLTNTEWGKKALEAAISQNEAAKALNERVKGIGGLDEGIVGMLKGKKKSWILGIIAAILAGALTGPALAAALGVSAASGTLAAGLGAGVATQRSLRPAA